MTLHTALLVTVKHNVIAVQYGVPAQPGLPQVTLFEGYLHLSIAI